MTADVPMRARTLWALLWPLLLLSSVLRVVLFLAFRDSGFAPATFAPSAVACSRYLW